MALKAFMPTPANGAIGSLVRLHPRQSFQQDCMFLFIETSFRCMFGLLNTHLTANEHLFKEKVFPQTKA